MACTIPLFNRLLPAEDEDEEDEREEEEEKIFNIAKNDLGRHGVRGAAWVGNVRSAGLVPHGTHRERDGERIPGQPLCAPMCA